jgi:hypothetical protein
MSNFLGEKKVTVTVTWVSDKDLTASERKCYAFFTTEEAGEVFKKEVEDYMELTHRTKYYERYDVLVVDALPEIIFPDDVCDVEIDYELPQDCRGRGSVWQVRWQVDEKPVRSIPLVLCYPEWWGQRRYFNFRFPKKTSRAKRKRGSVYVLVEAEEGEEDEDGSRVIRLPKRSKK